MANRTVELLIARFGARWSFTPFSDAGREGLVVSTTANAPRLMITEIRIEPARLPPAEV